MNILASYDWVKDFLKTDASVEDFAERVTASGNSVEEIIQLSDRFNKMVVGKIVKIKKHPDANKLVVVEIDVGRAAGPPPSEGGARGGLKSIQVVCGGSNLEEGRLVAVSLPGSKVRWHGKGDWIELKETKIRGVKSFGMIVTPAELGFEKLQGDEREIWDVTDITDAKPGTSLAKALDLNDVLFDIEVTTNRPDAGSMVGLAREASAVGLGDFTWKASVLPKTSKTSAISVEVKDFELCPRYQAVVIDGVKVGPSPWWLQKRLLLSGHRPINNIVDVTNYILHEMGQPLHVFDADKLEGNKIIVRKAKKGEKFLALDGEEYKLDSSMLVIADAKRPVAVAGVMGGEETGATDATTRVVIESANFNSVSVRRTARTLNLYSDSQSLFEKGLSTESTSAALVRAVELIKEIAGGEVVSRVEDERAEAYKPLSFPYDSKYVNERMGIEVSEKEQLSILKKLGFKVLPPAGGGIKGRARRRVEVPYWRDKDIEDSVDFVEEIARVYGYDNIPSKLPEGVLPKTIREPYLVSERKIKELLRGAGCAETFSSSFTSFQDLEKFNILEKDAVKILNPLSEDLTHMRTSLVPSMLLAVELNQHRRGHARMFEITSVHYPKKGDIPTMENRLLIGVYCDEGQVAFLEAKGIFERMMREVGVAWTLEVGSEDDHWHPGRVAQILVSILNPEPSTEIQIGTIGELDPVYAKRFGIDKRVALVDINFDKLLPLLGVTKGHENIPEFQDVKRDIAFVIDERIEYATLSAALHEAHELVEEVYLFDVYQGKGVDEGKKSMAFHVHLRASDRTLSSEEADGAMKALEGVLKDEFDGIIR